LRLENEVRAHLALDGANAGLWEWDIIRDETKWSKGFNRLHGIEHEGIGSYEIWRPRVHPQDIDRVENEIQKAISEIGTFYSEYRVELPNGELRWVGCQGKTLVGPDGTAASMTGHCGDVTRRKLADLAIIQNEKLAIAGRLSASIAHEVNTPLAAVTNLLYLMRLEALSESQTGFLDQATQQLDRVSQIANQTLKLSRSSGRGSRCKPSELIENTLRFLRLRLQSAQIEVTIEIRQDPEFFCSSGEMQQVLTNLIINSIEATAGPGKIRIRTSASVDWKNRASKGVRITVADTGSGMSSQTSRRMREAFFTPKREPVPAWECGSFTS
jgi:PAS domain S-box-containing protein